MPTFRTNEGLMGRSRFLAMLLLLLLAVSHGSARKVMEETVKQGGSRVELEGSGVKWRKMVGLLDYADPEPNTNPRTRFLLSPPPSPPSRPPQG
ncbi:Pectinesterase [Psidium guajava]|nr:Pectinesterase [Psidium guajava]